MRSDINSRDAVPRSLLLIDAPASEDVLRELAGTLRARLTAVSSREFLKESYEPSRVSAVLICPILEMPRRNALRKLFEVVHACRRELPGARIFVLLPSREEMSRGDFEKLGCHVEKWEGFVVGKIASLMIAAARNRQSNALVDLEFSGRRVTASTAKGSVVMIFDTDRTPLLLRKLSEEDREYSRRELALAAACEETQIRVYKERLNRKLASIANALEIKMEIVHPKGSKGYRLLVKKRTT